MAFIINGEKIADHVLEEEFESIKEYYVSRGEVVCCDRDEEFMAFARENVLNRVLLEQASIKKFGEVSADEVEAKFNQIISEHGGEDHFYENTGFNRGDEFLLRRKVKSGLTVDRYLNDQLGDMAEPSETELGEFYEKNIEKYLSPLQVEVNQLFVEPKSHEAARETFIELCQARRAILDGESFVAYAEKVSALPSKEIQMGYVRQQQNMPEIEAVIFSMFPGEISPVLATTYGFHMFEVTGRKDPVPLPMEEIPDLSEAFKLSRREDAISRIIDRLKETGSVEEIREEQEQPV